MKVAIIGCGKIADQHAGELHYVKGATLVACCDRELLMAQQLAERTPGAQAFDSIEKMLASTKPDVVHITTPPQAHLELALQCLSRGTHLYVEKPFTLEANEARQIIDEVARRGLRLTVGHNAQFTPAALEMRRIIATGFLGGPPRHLEAHYCYNLADPSYARALLGDRNHWVRRLPGGLLHNIISHGIAKIAEFASAEGLRVTARGHASPVLRGMGETDLIDELRVIIEDDSGLTAYFTFSSQVRPVLHRLQLLGPVNGLLVDDDQQVVIRLRGTKLKSYVESFVHPWLLAGQYVRNSCRNIGSFLRADFQSNFGMRHLMREFYKSIETDSEPPIPYREILLTAEIMDSIFDQLRDRKDASPESNTPLVSAIQ